MKERSRKPENEMNEKIIFLYFSIQKWEEKLLQNSRYIYINDIHLWTMAIKLSTNKNVPYKK